MRRFRFRLERFLEIKRYRERQAELGLAVAASRCVELQGRMSEARSRMAAELEARASGPGRVDLEALQTSELYRRHLVGVWEASARQLVVRERERREAQQVYIERSRERKVLDKLRERRAADYYKDGKRRDAKVIDDLAQGNRAARQREE
jgi:flagellar protein FliJ